MNKQLKVVATSQFKLLYPRSRTFNKKWKSFVARRNNWKNKYGFDIAKIDEKLVSFFSKTTRCKYCNKELSIDNISLDHIVPIARGGKIDDIDNVQFICKVCNRRKDIMTHNEYHEFLTCLFGFDVSVQKYVLMQLSKSSIHFYKQGSD